MKLRYAANIRIPTPRAHGLQVMKTCEAFARAGVQVELIVPRRYAFIKEDPFSYYGVEPLFLITHLPTFEIAWRGVSYGFGLQTLAFVLSLARYLRKTRDDSLLYVRGELGWLLPLFSRAAFVWENHIPRRGKAEARAVRRAQSIVVVTEQYKKDLKERYQIKRDKILVAPDGVDLERFSLNVGSTDARDARRKLGLPEDKKLVLYVGSDLPWKGVRSLREASAFLPDDYEVVFVGPIDSTGVRPNERFVGTRPHMEIPLWLSVADALVLTGDPTSEIARHYTSPLKLFEYMAARRPIVAVDLPSFRDVLSEENAVLVVPGDPKALAEGIVRAVGNSDRTSRIETAWEAVQGYSWERRAENILDLIRRIP